MESCNLPSSASLWDMVRRMTITVVQELIKCIFRNVINFGRNYRLFFHTEVHKPRMKLLEREQTCPTKSSIFYKRTVKDSATIARSIILHHLAVSLKEVCTW